MMQWMKARLARFFIVLIALIAVIGVAGVASAQAHAGSTPGVEDQKIVGSVQSVNWTQQTFALLADGNKSPVTISFDSKTNIEGGRATLKAGAHVRVEVLNSANGAIYATEVKSALSGRGSDDGVDDHGHDRGNHDVNDDHGRDG
jgi:hypothetical protein